MRKVLEGFGGMTCLKKLGMWDCKALEEFYSGICTLKALKDLQYNGCKSLRKIPKKVGGGV